MAKSLPTVSVVTPVFNGESAIPRLMDSLRAQDYPRERIEILLVDNRSTDRSVAVMRRYEEVKVLSQTKYQGPAATRNEGIRCASGDIVALIDADCWAGPRWISSGVRALTGSGADRVAGRVEFVLSRRPNLYEIYDSTVNFQQMDPVIGGSPLTGNLFVRRGVFDEVGLFDPVLLSYEDMEFSRRASAAGKTLRYATDAVVYHYARTSLAALVSKWIRTEYGAAQAWRRHGEAELHLWTKKANWRPLSGAWKRFAPEVQARSGLRWRIDAIANILRYAGNWGSFLGYYSIGRRP